jgi:hypothetical protein
MQLVNQSTSKRKAWLESSNDKIEQGVGCFTIPLGVDVACQCYAWTFFQLVVLEAAA